MADRGKLGRGKPKNYSDLEIEKRRKRIQAWNVKHGRIGSVARREAKRIAREQEVELVRRYAAQGIFVPIGAREEKSRR